MKDNQVEKIIDSLERISMVLGGILVSQIENDGKKNDQDKILALSRCGYSNSQIAKLAGMSTNALRVSLHRARKGKKKSKK